MYISDGTNNRILVYTYNSGNWTAGTSLDQSNDPTAPAWNTPYGVWVDSNGYLWVTDRLNFRVVKLDPAGRWIMTINLKPIDTNWQYPYAVLIDSQERLYVSFGHLNTTLNCLSCIRRYSWQ